MRQDGQLVVSPLVTEPKWPEGYVAVLREAGAQEKTIPYRVGWVRRFFGLFPGQRRSALGRAEIERFLSEVAAAPASSNWLVQQARDSLELYYEKFRGIALEPREFVPVSVSHAQCPFSPAPPVGAAQRADASSPSMGIQNTVIRYAEPFENVKGESAEIRTSNTQQGIAKEEVSPPLDTGPSAFAVQSSKGVGAATPCGRRSESGVARDTACRTHSKTAGTGETLNAQRPTPNAQGENTGETPASRGGRCNWEVLEERLRDVLRTEHYAYTTEQTYVGWVRRYVVFHGWRKPSALEAEHVHAFLRHLAVVEQVASSTQNQALNAVVFLYRNLIKKDIGDFGDFPRARRGLRLPVVASREQPRMPGPGQSVRRPLGRRG